MLQRHVDGVVVIPAKCRCIELISFVDVARHELCLGGVCEDKRETTCCFSSAIQYQLPTLSRATGVPAGNREKRGSDRCELV